MKNFFFSTVFAPSTGGIETMVELLCREFTALGHEVVLATLTPGDAGPFPFEVVRQPGLAEFARLLRWCDIHMQANVSLKHGWPRFLAPRKFVYQHNNVYQRDDGTQGWRDKVKTRVAKASFGIANSHYTAARTGAAHVVLNAYDDAIFTPVVPWADRRGDLVFLGRLVSQKGCDTLIEALAILARGGLRPGLTVIGDGADRAILEERVADLGLGVQVQFVGRHKGAALAALLNDHRVMVVPSRYEEPFGIVALEGLGCGCLPVVSERGGLLDAISGHGRTFPNGDAKALAQVLQEVLTDPGAARALLDGREAHLARCTARAVAEAYLRIFEEWRSR